jgi:hypothetical protein
MWLFQCKAPPLETSAMHAASNWKAMRKTAWIWFLGCAAWLLNGVVNLRLQSLAQAKLAFTIAIVFLAAGLFFRQQRR